MQFLRNAQEESCQPRDQYSIHDGKLGQLDRAAWQRIAAWVQKLADEMPVVGDEGAVVDQHVLESLVTFSRTLPEEYKSVFDMICVTRNGR